jgi:hypothetical protein
MGRPGTSPPGCAPRPPGLGRPRRRPGHRHRHRSHQRHRGPRRHRAARRRAGHPRAARSSRRAPPKRLPAPPPRRDPSTSVSYRSRQPYAVPAHGSLSRYCRQVQLSEQSGRHAGRHVACRVSSPTRRQESTSRAASLQVDGASNAADSLRPSHPSHVSGDDYPDNVRPSGSTFGFEAPSTRRTRRPPPSPTDSCDPERPCPAPPPTPPALTVDLPAHSVKVACPPELGALLATLIRRRRARMETDAAA